VNSALQLLLALVRGTRSESRLAVDPNMALADAMELYRASEGRLGTDEEIIIHILTTRSPMQLNMALQYYRQNFGHDFEKVNIYYQLFPPSTMKK
jgi:hypothetical protein